MTLTTDRLEVILEVGKSRTFAIAPDWPGWCRSGRDEASALQALIDTAPRYARVLSGTSLEFQAPTTVSGLLVVERLPGNATTDYGAPDSDLPADALPVDTAELQRMETLLKAGWNTFDRVVQAAAGKSLRKGPRGGGRDLMKVVEHVQEVEIAYLNILGGKITPNHEIESNRAIVIRDAVLATLNLAVRGEVPARGPRGGLRWTPRYFVRRLVWHDLDHAWEIEDRVE